MCKDTTVLFGKSVQQQPQITLSHQNEDNTLLLGLDNLISSPNKQEQYISPIPFSNMLGIEASSHLLTGSEFILKGPDCLQA